VLGPSTLNTLQTNTINNTSSLTSNSITCTTGLTSNTITCASTLTASNGFTVSAGTVSLPANSLTNAAVNGLGSLLGRLQNLTGSVAVVSTITSNVLTINYSSNNGQSIFCSPTSNFSGRMGARVARAGNRSKEIARQGLGMCGDSDLNRLRLKSLTLPLFANEARLTVEQGEFSVNMRVSLPRFRLRSPVGTRGARLLSLGYSPSSLVACSFLLCLILTILMMLLL